MDDEYNDDENIVSVAEPEETLPLRVEPKISKPEKKSIKDELIELIDEIEKLNKGVISAGHKRRNRSCVAGANSISEILNKIKEIVDKLE